MSCSAVPGHLLADNAPESLFPLRGFPLDAFVQRRIDQRLVAQLAARPIGDRTEIVDQVFIQPDGDPHLSGLSRQLSHYAVSPALTEVVTILHVCVSYNCGAACQANATRFSDAGRLHKSWGGPPGPRPTPPSACSHPARRWPRCPRGGTGASRADQGVCPTTSAALPIVEKRVALACQAAPHSG